MIHIQFQWLIRKTIFFKFQFNYTVHTDSVSVITNQLSFFYFLFCCEVWYRTSDISLWSDYSHSHKSFKVSLWCSLTFTTHMNFSWYSQRFSAQHFITNVISEKISEISTAQEDGQNYVVSSSFLPCLCSHFFSCSFALAVHSSLFVISCFKIPIKCDWLLKESNLI